LEAAATLALALLIHFFVSAEQSTLDAEKRFDYDIIYFSPQQVNIDAHIFKMILKRGQRPLVAKILLSRILVLNEVVAFFVHTIVG